MMGCDGQVRSPPRIPDCPAVTGLRLEFVSGGGSPWFNVDWSLLLAIGASGSGSTSTSTSAEGAAASRLQHRWRVAVRKVYSVLNIVQYNCYASGVRVPVLSLYIDSDFRLLIQYRFSLSKSCEARTL